MLTNAQYQALKADVLADPVLAALPDSPDRPYAIAAAYNQAVALPATVWRTDAPVALILDAIAWDKYTPTDAADGTATYTNRILAVQTKQMNLQNMLIGRATIDASRANIRAGLRDAVIGLPTGTGGAATTAGGVGGVNVLNACLRQTINRFEKLFATADSTTGSVTAKLLGVEGNLSPEDAANAMVS